MRSLVMLAPPPSSPRVAAARTRVLLVVALASGCHQLLPFRGAPAAAEAGAADLPALDAGSERAGDAARSDATRADARSLDARTADARTADARATDARTADARATDAIPKPDAHVPLLTAIGIGGGAGPDDNVEAHGIALAGGAVRVAGLFSGTVALASGPTYTAQAGSIDAVLLELTSDLALVGPTLWSSTGDDRLEAVTADPAGGVVAVGQLQGKVGSCGYNPGWTGGIYSLVAAFDAAGACVSSTWSQVPDAAATSVALLASGERVVGHVGNVQQVGTVVRYASGGPIVKPLAGALPYAVAVVPGTQDVLVTGTVKGGFSPGGSCGMSTGNANGGEVFLARFNSSLVCQELHRWGGSAASDVGEGRAIVVDEAHGRIYLAGRGVGSVGFASSPDPFGFLGVFKLSVPANPFSTQLGPSAYHALALDPASGDLWLAGTAQSKPLLYRLAGGSVSSMTSAVWTGGGQGEARGLARDGAGRIFVAGSYTGSLAAAWGSATATLTTKGQGKEAFVIRLTP